MKKYNVLHIGINSSIPIIFNTFCNNIYLLYRPGVERVFREQKDLPCIQSKIDITKKTTFFKRIREIKNIVKKNDINIVFVNRKDDMIAAKLAFLFSKKRPMILGTFHNPQAWLNDRKVKSFVHLMKWCLDGHLSMASFAYDKLIKYHFPSKRIIFFQNYIKYEAFIQKKSYSCSDVFKICYSGTIDPRKNELFIAKAIKELLTKYQIIYDIYGPFNDDTYKEEFVNYINSENLQNNIHVYPRLSPTEEMKAFLEHDLYLSASKSEMCPLNLLNAKACAMPILISDSFGQQDLITDGIDGIKYDENNLDDLVKKISMLIENESIRKQIGCSAYIAVSKTNSYHVAAERLKTFIEELEKEKDF